MLEVRDEQFGKGGRRKFPTIQRINYRESWIWDQYLLKNSKWEFGYMGSLNLWNAETKKPRNQETENLWNQETKKLWNQETKNLRHFLFSN